MWGLLRIEKNILFFYFFDFYFKKKVFITQIEFVFLKTIITSNFFSRVVNVCIEFDRIETSSEKELYLIIIILRNDAWSRIYAHACTIIDTSKKGKTGVGSEETIYLTQHHIDHRCFWEKKTSFSMVNWCFYPVA